MVLWKMKIKHKIEKHKIDDRKSKMKIDTKKNPCYNLREIKIKEKDSYKYEDKNEATDE